MEKYISIFRKRRRFLAILILIVGFLGARAIVKTDPVPAPVPQEEPELLTYEDLVGSDSTASLHSGLEENITERVIQKYGEELFRANRDNVGKSGGVVGPLQAPSEEYLDALLTRELEEELFIPLFNEADVRTLTDASREDEERYIKQYVVITEQNTKTLTDTYLSAAHLASTESQPQSLLIHVGAAEQQINDLLSMEAPDSLVPLHVEFLNAWQRRFVIGKALLDEDDPLGQVQAVDALSSAMEQEANLEFLITLALQEYE